MAERPPLQGSLLPFAQFVSVVLPATSRTPALPTVVILNSPAAGSSAHSRFLRDPAAAASHAKSPSSPQSTGAAGSSSKRQKIVSSKKTTETSACLPLQERVHCSSVAQPASADVAALPSVVILNSPQLAMQQLPQHRAAAIVSAGGSSSRRASGLAMLDIIITADERMDSGSAAAQQQALVETTPPPLNAPIAAAQEHLWEVQARLQRKNAEKDALELEEVQAQMLLASLKPEEKSAETSDPSISSVHDS